MMTTNDRLSTLLKATPSVLQKIDDILLGKSSIRSQEKDTRLVEITEAAKRLNVSRPTIYRLLKAGKLKSVELCGTQRVKLQSVYDYLG